MVPCGAPRSSGGSGERLSALGVQSMPGISRAEFARPTLPIDLCVYIYIYIHMFVFIMLGGAGNYRVFLSFWNGVHTAQSACPPTIACTASTPAHL